MGYNSTPYLHPRVLDVSLGTLRIVFISRGDKLLSPLLGFFEVLIWIVAMGQVMQNLSSPAAYLGWSLGFAAGNYVGLVIEQKLALGMVVIRVITSSSVNELMLELADKNYRNVIIEAESEEGRMNVLFSIVKRKNVDEITNLIRTRIPNAFYTIEGIQRFSDGVYHPAKRHWTRRMFPVKKAK